MKRIIGLLALVPALALAAGVSDPAMSPKAPPSFGLSGNVVGDQPEHSHSDDRTADETHRLLNGQAHSGVPSKSEISAPVYVQTQQRLSNSFKEKIPDFTNDQTRKASK